MSKHRLLSKPTRIEDLSLDDLLEDDDDWREKAERLQARRWKQIRAQEF